MISKHKKHKHTYITAITAIIAIIDKFSSNQNIIKDINFKISKRNLFNDQIDQ